MKGLIKPQLYLESENLPDVCCLVDKVIKCVGQETSYDWFDYFKVNCQKWQRNYKRHKKIVLKLTQNNYRVCKIDFAQMVDCRKEVKIF